MAVCLNYNWTKLDEDFLEFCADTVEWCPIKDYQNLFVCGTYQLKENENHLENDKNNQRRIGQLLLYSFKDKLLHLQTIYTAAILDTKWCNFKINGDIVLGAVDAEGFLIVYRLNLTNYLVQLEILTKVMVNNDCLCLSLDWSNGKTNETNPLIVISDSKGFVSLFTFSNDRLSLRHLWKGHDFEAWICCFDYWNPSTILSGGDDCKLKVFDLRLGGKSPILCKSHNAGVTSLHCSTKYQYTFASGSYDENIYIWDLRKFKDSIGSCKTSGGVWRVKWQPDMNDYLLAACMYGSFHVVNVERQQQPRIVCDYKEHKSICYGGDWSRHHDKSLNNLIVTCSFYDKLLNVSRVQLTPQN